MISLDNTNAAWNCDIFTEWFDTIGKLAPEKKTVCLKWIKDLNTAELKCSFCQSDFLFSVNELTPLSRPWAEEWPDRKSLPTLALNNQRWRIHTHKKTKQVNLLLVAKCTDWHQSI